ncbi:Bcr/CflA family multidrug efflux MFS transporter [Marichromatium bheemlicum]|uniref:Bcr/CflA family efflux transporter n=1 Tax=Marichromatium bheemlicum TaxID=365339 RepID=A0ABX1I396_9GAMM|nr:Bcr/CflA family multidrug efflux MFS transporter [Marichromatium bheemlicum]NKN31987.1 Bcr/CflA family multidrug efflux MFS transporter [Marichromatium bheemlicum]
MTRAIAPTSPALVLPLALLAALTPFAIDMYLPGLPEIARALDGPIELAQLSVAIYLGVFALAQLVIGPLSDVLGRRLVISAGLGLFMTAALGCALALSLPVLIGARALQALGGAAVAVTVPALVRDLFDKEDYARVMALIMLVMSFAPLIAPTLGALVIGLGGWRAVFIALLAIGAAALVLFLTLVPETLHHQHRHRLDLGHILRNYLRLCGHRAALAYLLAGATSFSGMMVFIVASPYVYIEYYGLGAGQFGLVFAANVALTMVTATLNARLIPRLGADRLLAIGLATQAMVALVALGLALHGAPPIWLLAPTTALYLGMMGLVLGNATAGFMSFFPRLAGTASALAGAARFGAGATAATLVSLAQATSPAPLLLGMASSGLGALLLFHLIAPRHDTPR